PLAESDPDPLIRELASAIIDVASLPPPSTQPSNQLTDIPGPSSAPSQMELPTAPLPQAPMPQAPLPQAPRPQAPGPNPNPTSAPSGGQDNPFGGGFRL